MNVVRVIAIASATWTFAIASTIFKAPHPVVILLVGVSVTASVWIIAAYVANKLKRELLHELHSSDVLSFNNNRR